MKDFYTLLILMFLPSVVIGQDERFFRNFLSQDLKIKKDKLKKKFHFRSISQFYDYDLNQDNRNESFLFEMRDGQGFLYIYGYNQKKIFAYEFDSHGKNARPYKISIKKISSKTKVLVFHYYEGNTSYLEFKGTSRLYFLTIDNDKLKTLSMYKGPIISDEFQNFKKNHYHQRKYRLKSLDYNKDGINELAVEYSLTASVYFYKLGGKWISF